MNPQNKNAIFALVDGNNFFVSCERLFNPLVRNRPVVVLSNNDGCVISRSQEAKDLGILMGAPFFKYKKLIEDKDVAVFSSNYQLYGDISKRIMASLKLFVPDIEVYSIDEAFLRLDRLEGIGDIVNYTREICQKVEQWVGIPLSIGIGPTKTLAKVANLWAKKDRHNKVFDLRDRYIQEDILDKLPVGKIWGIGRKWEKKLQALGIMTALELQKSNSKMIRNKFSVVGERIVTELKGISCLELEVLMPRKNIMSSRSFSKPVQQLEELEEAVSNYAAKAAVKLRAQKSVAQGIHIFIRTNRFSKVEVPYTASTSRSFIVPTK